MRSMIVLLSVIGMTPVHSAPVHYRITIEKTSQEAKPAKQNTGASGKYAYAVSKNLEKMREQAAEADKTDRKICFVRKLNELEISLKFFIKDSCAGSEGNNTQTMYCKKESAEAFANEVGVQFDKAVNDKKTSTQTMGYYTDKVVGTIMDQLTSGKYSKACVSRINGV
ncbi:MAG: hypothetical protein KA715_06945 [Xanthomonadaceae bacterium]|nr:hypothetical protein [Xanthomonadaceae bacterium]